MKLHELKKTHSARKKVGRGTASGVGKTAGRGTKGQKSRAGHHYAPRWFEGGQMRLTVRIPKLRGFRNPVGHLKATVTTAQLDQVSGTKAGLAELQEAGVIGRQVRYLSVVAGDKPSKKLSVTAHKVTAGAKKQITAAGGTVTETKPKPEKTDAKPKADAG